MREVDEKALLFAQEKAFTAGPLTLDVARELVTAYLAALPRAEAGTGDVERVAKALAAVDAKNGRDPQEHYEAYPDMWERFARAAIAALPPDPLQDRLAALEAENAVMRELSDELANLGADFLWTFRASLFASKKETARYVAALHRALHDARAALIHKEPSNA